MVTKHTFQRITYTCTNTKCKQEVFLIFEFKDGRRLCQSCYLK